VSLSTYQGSIAHYWDNKHNPVNLQLGELDGLYHHHYGVGEVDQSVLDGSDRAILTEMHRLETAQATCLLSYFEGIQSTDRLLDAGCGRGGTSLMAHQEFGCDVWGVTLSEKQADFANEQARNRGVSDRVTFHVKNMLDTRFGPGSFKGIWNNESTMYVDLFDLFAEHARLLERGGRYVVITGCSNDAYGLPSKEVNQINAHYECNVHSRGTYLKAMLANKLVPVDMLDLTEATIPYWELRKTSSVATGIEDAFLTAYEKGSFQYLLIAADRV